MAAFEPFKTIVNLFKVRILALIDIIVTIVQIFLQPFGLGNVTEQLTEILKSLVGRIADLFGTFVSLLDEVYARFAGLIPCPCSQ